MDEEVELEIGPRDDMLRALRQALDAVNQAVEKSRAAADHADDVFGTPNPVSGDLCGLIGVLRVWHASAAVLLETCKKMDDEGL